MRIALIAPPFIPVPPPAYGGTELYIAHLAEALTARGHDVTVFANGESTVACRIRALYGQQQWPLPPGETGTLKNVEHSTWAMHEAGSDPYDLVHVNDALAVPLSRFLSKPLVHTLHHPHENALSELYGRYPAVHYVAISDAQRSLESMPRLTTIRHGIRLQDYQMIERKQPYLAFLGRMAPVKAPHLAIEAARRAAIPLKMAGEIQPVFQSYWETMVAPHIDGRNVEFVGEASHEVKNELLGNATALLFPIQWHEPFGLVMIEAMACGTPVLALPGGAVREVVADGISGWMCASVGEIAERARDLHISAWSCRSYVDQQFSDARMAASYESLYLACAGSAPQSPAAELWC